MRRGFTAATPLADWIEARYLLWESKIGAG